MEVGTTNLVNFTVQSSFVLVSYTVHFLQIARMILFEMCGECKYF